MVVSDDDEEWASGNGAGDGDGDGNLDEVITIVDNSAAGGSAGSILRLPERTEDDSSWLSHDGIKPATSFSFDSAGQTEPKSEVASVCPNRTDIGGNRRHFFFSPPTGNTDRFSGRSIRSA